jgi:mandelamide amidase
MKDLTDLLRAQIWGQGDGSGLRAVDSKVGRIGQLACWEHYTIEEASALKVATQADRSLRTGRSAPLLGVPLAVKDGYLTKGLITTFGTSVPDNFKPTHAAEAVARVKEVGAIIFGKNNLAEMSYALMGLNEHHGQVMNPYDRAHLTGGSSSGAGAAVAARIVPAAFGRDTVGSIRVPASLWCRGIQADARPLAG